MVYDVIARMGIGHDIRGMRCVRIDGGFEEDGLPEMYARLEADWACKYHTAVELHGSLDFKGLVGLLGLVGNLLECDILLTYLWQRLALCRSGGMTGKVCVIPVKVEPRSDAGDVMSGWDVFSMRGLMLAWEQDV